MYLLRITAMLLFLLMPIAGCAKHLTVLVVGQSLSANSGEYRDTQIVDNLYQIDLKGDRIPAQDPFVWASGEGGSIWMPLGKKILAAGLADSVTFMPIGKGGTSLENWLTTGSYVNGKMHRALALIEHKKLKFDYVFFLQGSSDTHTPMQDYASRFYRLHHLIQQRLQQAGSNPAWIIARHSRCDRLFSRNIWLTQQAVGLRDNRRHYFVGPDMHRIGTEDKYDRCHLNRSGQEKAAELWFETLKNVMGRRVNASDKTLF